MDWEDTKQHFCILLYQEIIIKNNLKLTGSLVFIFPERRIGAVGSLQDLNVAISRAKEKLFVVGSFEMMMNGWSSLVI